MLVSIMGFSRNAVLSDVIIHYFRYCIVDKNPRWPPFVQGQAINSYHFRHNKGRFVFLVSIMGFSGMSYIVVLSGNILAIALWVKKSKMAAIC